MSQKMVPEISPDRAWIGAPTAAGLRNPTVALLAAVTIVVAFGTTAYLAGWLSWPSVLGLHTVALYVVFTPLHEAVHGVAHRSRPVNDLIGRVSGLLLAVSLPVFRAVHLAHHSHTNDPERDPDFLVARRPRALLPLWCAGITLAYYRHFYGRRLWRRQRDLHEALVVEGALAVILVVSIAGGWWRPLVVCWFVPSLGALLALAFLFDFLPHYPYDTRARYYDTRIYPGRILNVLLLGQNYHLIHHLWTTIPWYGYQGVFRRIQPELVERNVRIGWRVTPLPARVRETASVSA
jgi:beta-carotene hydroxylase